MADKDADKYGSDITQYSEISEPGKFTHTDGLPFTKRFIASASAIDQAKAEESVTAGDAAKDVGLQAAGLAWDAYSVLTDPIGYLGELTPDQFRFDPGVVRQVLAEIPGAPLAGVPPDHLQRWLGV